MKASVQRRVPIVHSLLPRTARLLFLVALVPVISLADDIEVPKEPQSNPRTR